MASRWRAHFEANAVRPVPAAPDVAGIPAAWRAPLAASLARFQLGEAGEGRIARQIDGVVMRGVDDDYRASLKLFVREEARHARILAGVVRALGGSLLRQAWSERLFVRGRRLLGVRTKLLVLLVAEVVGLGFYTLLARRLGDCAVARQLTEIAADERAHLEFHAAFFRVQARGPARRWLFRAAWWSVAALACGVVVFDHRRTLRALDVPPITALRRFVGLMREVDAAVLANVHAAAPGEITSTAVL